MVYTFTIDGDIVPVFNTLKQMIVIGINDINGKTIRIDNIKQFNNLKLSKNIQDFV
jgi:hypothetical protein